jgi:hypothetical protein
VGYGLEDQGFESQQSLRIFLFTTVSKPALGHTHPPIWWVPEALYLGVKRSRRKSDYSPPSSAEVKNMWSYTSTSQYAFMAWCTVKVQGLTLTDSSTSHAPHNTYFCKVVWVTLVHVILRVSEMFILELYRVTYTKFTGYYQPFENAAKFKHC